MGFLALVVMRVAAAISFVNPFVGFEELSDTSRICLIIIMTSWMATEVLRDAILQLKKEHEDG